MLTAMTTRGFLPLFREKMVRLEATRSVVFSVSAAVPAPQQLRAAARIKDMGGTTERERERKQVLSPTTIIIIIQIKKVFVFLKRLLFIINCFYVKLSFNVFVVFDLNKKTH